MNQLRHLRSQFRASLQMGQKYFGECFLKDFRVLEEEVQRLLRGRVVLLLEAIVQSVIYLLHLRPQVSANLGGRAFGGFGEVGSRRGKDSDQAGYQLLDVDA